MAERHSYEPVLSPKAADFLVSLPRTRQRKLVTLLAQLAADPFHTGDYSLLDDSAREVQFILIGDLLIAYWADHPVKELRIVDIDEV
jgi:hypothetical protein